MSMVQLSIFATFELASSVRVILSEDSMGEKSGDEREIVPVGGVTSSRKLALVAVAGVKALP